MVGGVRLYEPLPLRRDAAVGAARRGILAAGVDDHHAGAADAGVARDREAAALDDVGAAVQGQPGVSRDADLAVDARLDRRGRIAAEVLGSRSWSVPTVLGSGSEASGSATTAAPVTGAGLKLALPLFWTPRARRSRTL